MALCTRFQSTDLLSASCALFFSLGLETFLIEQHEEEEVEGGAGSEVSDIPDPLMVLIPGGNGSLSGTAAVTERKYTALFLTECHLGSWLNTFFFK